MRTRIGCLAVLASVMGVAAEAAALGENYDGAPGNRGLSSMAPMAQAATPSIGSTPQPDYILKYCKETEHTTTAFSGVAPALGLKIFLDRNDKARTQKVDLATIKITLLDGPEHGELVSGTSDYDRSLSAYRYDPEPEYIGKDKAVFMAEFEGKRYKIVVELHVFATVGENGDFTTCPPPQLIKVNGKPKGKMGS